MFFRLINYFGLFLFSIFLVGCSWIPKPSFLQYRDKNYLSAHAIAPLKIPEGISSTAFSNDYPIADRNYSKAEKDVDLTPPGLNSET